MLSRIVFGVFIGIVSFIVLSILVVVLEMVGLGVFAAIISRFVYWLAILLGILAFFGSTPTVWQNWRGWIR